VVIAIKRLASVLVVLALCLILPACVQDKTPAADPLSEREAENIKTEVSTSEVTTSKKFSEEEIAEAKECVRKEFAHFSGCELIDLRYDEKQSDVAAKEHHSLKAREGDLIVLFSDFKVGSSGGDGSLNPDSTYTDWGWFLIKG